MGYHTRVFTKNLACPHLNDIVEVLRPDFPIVTLRLEAGEAATWTQLVLCDKNRTPIAAIERNPVEPGSLGAYEILEFMESVKSERPSSAVPWLMSFLGSVSVIYAFQHLSGSENRGGEKALSALRNHLWGLGESIIQADGEGFTNDSGYHILWQFSDRVSGKWWMAVLEAGSWVSFQMELGNMEHREAFLAGRVPSTAKNF
jgi:hypothetical protein